MDREQFAQLLDQCWNDFRRQAIAAYPEQVAGLRTPGSGRELQAGSPQTQVAARVHPDFDDTSPGPAMSHQSSLKSKRLPDDDNMSVIDAEIVTASTTSAMLRSALKNMAPSEALATSQRLRIRLGVLPHQQLVSGKSLHDAVVALGLTRYGVEDMNDFVNELASYIGLYFKDMSTASFTKVKFQDDVDFIGVQPLWKWPPKDATSPCHDIPLDARLEQNVVPAQALMELFLAEEGQVHRKVFHTSALLQQFKAMREILLASDANRLVAELTFVRINDLAAPPEAMHPLMYIEPFVALMILANGIMIGFQTDPNYQEWEGWIYLETAFAVLLILEILFRMHFLRCHTYWCGPERYWNWFDLFLAVTSGTDLMLQIVAQQASDIAGTGLLRFTRLIRLARIVKVFRLKIMKDLRLMVKGWIAGLRTLVLAFTLLFAVLYVISGFATMALGGQLEVDGELWPHFQTIPASMFTAFRCFTGECVSSRGHPMTDALATKFGLAFQIPYVASYMLVTMGIFNVILAVYVDITMRAAKENDVNSAEQYARESIRVARCARELLKRFATAYRELSDADQGPSAMDMMSSMEFTSNRAGVFTDDDVHDQIEISKELFLVVIQDRGVQQLMDELDLPPDRANMFEVIDADGNGTLHVQELVQGMLKIRGDLTKSDTVAALLATKALQSTVSQLKQDLAQTIETLHYNLNYVEPYQRTTTPFEPFQRNATPFIFQHHSDEGVDVEAEPRASSKVHFPLSPLPVQPAKPPDVTEESDNDLAFLPRRLSQ
ncbi:Voltage-dependent L-type calcium channel subunit alpha-1S [Symbiodinium microadriaticum]|uniref:Voltage-dependent L-type calcium channel subunit alpha-1S n=1 Tax=Symbiodinium microadriaticum TaxID=2951 RepID=A0A1Q9DDX8_SYMMI|nr:Voltage-dependent L-type calcium channel subunit alpha-1S [Symbiodinium microadriaticum]